jgi:RNA polymerase sigma-70 factor (ECF subfamily)
MPGVGEGREEVEDQALAQIRRADFAGAATTIVRGYGAEIYGFLLGRTRDETAATDAFSMFTEDLWRGLPSFEGRASVRVWAYTLARHAAIRQQAAPHRRRDRNVSLSEIDALSDLADRVRTETSPYLRTELKTKLAELRARLSEDERTLLILRVDRGLEWVDVARVFFPEHAGNADTELRSEAARLRKRFQQIKARIRRMAKEAGLIEP